MAKQAATPEKAEIQVVDPTRPSQVIDTIACHFRPTQVGYSKTANWSSKAAGGHNVPHQTFSGGQAAQVSLELLFDTSATGADVRDTTDKLLKLVLKKDKEKQPPLCRFKWGRLVSFLSYVSSVSVTFTFFLPNGTPVRAEVKATLVQYSDDSIFPRQNPTSYSEARKTWVVVAGETLDWIAYQEYGDPAAWRHIALTNGLTDPLNLRPGQILKLTPLSAGQG